jgi:hypothetical protein
VRRAFEPEAGDYALSPAARLAAAAVSGAGTGAKMFQAELLYGALDVLSPDTHPQDAPSVDEVLNPFASAPDFADRYLRGLGPKDRAEHTRLHRWNSERPVWEDYASHASAQALEGAREAASEEIRRQQLPGVDVFFGKADRQNLHDQGNAIAACLRARTPFVLVDPISGLDSFLAVHGDTLWAAAAIAAFGPEDVATAVASGPAVAVTTRGRGLVSLNASPWIPITETSHAPELIRSSLMLPGEFARRPSYQVVALPEMVDFNWLSGNAMLLNAVVLGGIGAGFQPPCDPWDACVVPVAATAGRTVARVDTEECLNVGQLHRLLLDALCEAERLPALVIARHEVAAKRLVREVRQYPAS